MLLFKILSSMISAMKEKISEDKNQVRQSPRITVTRDYAVIVNMEDLVQTPNYKKNMIAAKELANLIKNKQNETKISQV